MAQTRRAIMYTRFCILLFMAVIADACDLETQYEKHGQCCKMCGPGKRMKLNTDCRDPVCEDCGDLEYQDGYTKENKCKPQPTCDTNLNFLKQVDPSKTQLSQCQCIPDHHCPTPDCDGCVRNTVCQPGQHVYRNGTRVSDTQCEPCPSGTFSSIESAYTCQPYTECSSGLSESKPGTSTSDRICAVHMKPIVGAVVAVLFLAVVIALAVFIYKRGKMGSASFSHKLQHCLLPPVKIYQPTKDEVHMETEQPLETQNEPQEVIEPEASLQPGISENGQPVIQDHSKSSLISQPETGPVESFSDDL